MNNYELFEKARRIGKGFKTSGQVGPSFRYVKLALDHLLIHDKYLYRELINMIPAGSYSHFCDHIGVHIKPEDINILATH